LVERMEILLGIATVDWKAEKKVVLWVPKFVAYWSVDQVVV